MAKQLTQWLWCQTAWHQNLAPTQTSCVSSCKLLIPLHVSFLWSEKKVTVVLFQKVVAKMKWYVASKAFFLVHGTH